MSRKFKVKARFENGFLKPINPLNLNEGENVEIIVISEDIKENIDVSETVGLMKLVENDKAFDFLNDEREDIYSTSDLKERFI